MAYYVIAVINVRKMAVTTLPLGSTPRAICSKDLLSGVLRLESPRRSLPSFISSPLPPMSFYDLVSHRLSSPLLLRSSPRCRNNIVAASFYILIPLSLHVCDYVLALTVENFLEHHLQTLLFKAGMAKSIHHAKVLIRQRHIRATVVEIASGICCQRIWQVWRPLSSFNPISAHNMPDEMLQLNSALINAFMTELEPDSPII
ncbi:hypothetical protein Ahy_B06g082758 isoform B [Arachis hypogaea]|uniref:Uncharacterized protein n=1 Tax=Arachis hypogaea TaxID=3818 RepID=A0A444YP27_ARAHY|nr:hypothetical protein Ahy_B06g082758 isoform B [Arachis hypogaea]